MEVEINMVISCLFLSLVINQLMSKKIKSRFEQPLVNTIPPPEKNQSWIDTTMAIKREVEVNLWTTVFMTS